MEVVSVVCEGNVIRVLRRDGKEVILSIPPEALHMRKDIADRIGAVSRATDECPCGIELVHGVVSLRFERTEVSLLLVAL